MNILITGVAGFIGYSFANFLLNKKKKSYWN
jgi:nucleoside-diphosphate-sugar epimerase